MRRSPHAHLTRIALTALQVSLACGCASPKTYFGSDGSLMGFDTRALSGCLARYSSRRHCLQPNLNAPAQRIALSPLSSCPFEQCVIVSARRRKVSRRLAMRLAFDADRQLLNRLAALRNRDSPSPFWIEDTALKLLAKFLFSFWREFISANTLPADADICQIRADGSEIGNPELLCLDPIPACLDDFDLKNLRMQSRIRETF
jgi:hypothetical protein